MDYFPAFTRVFVHLKALAKHMALHTNSQIARRTAFARSFDRLQKVGEFSFALLPPCFRERAVVTVQSGRREQLSGDCVE
jgi:hypothetical protein